jgi:hypothetical protein
MLSIIDYISKSLITILSVITIIVVSIVNYIDKRVKKSDSNYQKSKNIRQFIFLTAGIVGAVLTLAQNFVIYNRNLKDVKLVDSANAEVNRLNMRLINLGEMQLDSAKRMISIQSRQFDTTLSILQNTSSLLGSSNKLLNTQLLQSSKLDSLRNVNNKLSSQLVEERVKTLEYFNGNRSFCYIVLDIWKNRISARLVHQGTNPISDVNVSILNITRQLKLRNEKNIAYKEIKSNQALEIKRECTYEMVPIRVLYPEDNIEIDWPIFERDTTELEFMASIKFNNVSYSQNFNFKNPRNLFMYNSRIVWKNKILYKHEQSESQETIDSIATFR